jgi:hypothetical protein
MPIKEPTEDGPRVVESATEARQGETGHNNRWVLLIGLFGAVAVLLIALLIFGLGTPA